MNKFDIDFQYETFKYGYKKRVTTKKEALVLNGMPEDTVVYSYHVYTPDFFIMKDGEIDLIIEVKGYPNAEARSVILNFARCNPDLMDKYLVVLAKDQYDKTIDKKWSKWFEDNGIRYSIGVPASLIKEYRKDV